MVKPYDVSTVVSRSYISEQMQDHMQKGHGNNDAKFMDTLKQLNDDKSKTVSKNESMEKLKVDQEEARKKDEQRKRKKEVKVKGESLFPIDSEHSILDIKV